jgi:hypothetical protein
MIRKPRDKRYSVKSYLIKGDSEYTFWCTPIKNKMITSDMGLPMANGNASFETDSTLEFKINEKVNIGGEILTIDDVKSRVDTKDLNSFRGRPSYIQTIQVS